MNRASAAGITSAVLIAICHAVPARVEAQTLEPRTFVPVAEIEYARSLHSRSPEPQVMLMHLGVLWAYDPRAAVGVAIRPGDRSHDVAPVVELRLRRRLTEVWTVEVGPGMTFENGIDQHIGAQLRYADFIALTFSLDAIGQQGGKEWRTYAGLRGVGRTGLVALPLTLVVSSILEGRR